MNWYKIVFPANPLDSSNEKFNSLFSRLYRDGSQFLRSGMVFFATASPDETSVTYYLAPEAYSGLVKFVEVFDPTPCERPNIKMLMRYQPS